MPLCKFGEHYETVSYVKHYRRAGPYAPPLIHKIEINTLVSGVLQHFYGFPEKIVGSR
jgi:hypothetical protein